MRTAARVAVIASLFLAWSSPAYSWLDGATYIKVWRAKQSLGRGDIPRGEEARYLADCGFFFGFTGGVAESLDGVAYSLPNDAEVVAVVERYLEDHPEKWNLPARQMIAAALADAYPKRDK